MAQVRRWVSLLAGSQRRTLQADAYAGFNQLYDDGRIQQAACWAHYWAHYPDFGLNPKRVVSTRKSPGLERKCHPLNEPKRATPGFLANREQWFLLDFAPPGAVKNSKPLQLPTTAPDV
jgi:hypothetical protein